MTIKIRWLAVTGALCVLALLAGGCASSPDRLSAGHLPALRDAPADRHATVAALAFSPDGQLLAAADGRAGTVTIWRLDGPDGPRRAARLGFPAPSAPGDPERTPAGGPDTRPDVDSVRFAPDGRLLAVHVFQQFGVTQPSVSFWSLTDPTRPTRVGWLPDTGRTGSAGIGFSPTGTLLAVRDHDSAATTLWDVTAPAHARRVGGLEADLGSGGLSMSPDGATLAVGGPGGTVLWDVGDPADPRPRGPVLGPFVVCAPAIPNCYNRQGSDHLDSVRISPDGDTLAIGGCDGYVLTYDISGARVPRPTGRLAAHTTTRDESCVEGLAFSPDSHVLAAADIEGTTTLWDMTDADRHPPLGRPLGGGHPGNGYSVAFSPDGRLLATGGAADATILLWDVSTPADPVPLTDLPDAPPPRPAPAGGRLSPAGAGAFGIDMSTPMTTTRLARLDAPGPRLAARGIPATPEFIGRYVSVGPRERQDRDLSAAEVASILGAGRSLVVFQRALGNGPHNWLEPDERTGRAIGGNAVANARLVGLPRGTQLFLDVENVDPRAGHTALADYCEAWAGRVRAAGYRTGLYAGLGMGAHYGLTGDEFDGLAFDSYWKPGNIELPVPTTHGYAAVQHHPPAFDLPVSPDRDPAFLVDADNTQTDARGGTVTLLGR